MPTGARQDEGSAGAVDETGTRGNPAGAEGCRLGGRYLTTGRARPV